MIDASGSWGVLRIFVDPQELKASKMPKKTIVIERTFFIVLCFNDGAKIQLLPDLAPIKRLGKQLFVVLPKHSILGLDEFRVIGQKLEGGLADLRD